MMRSVYITWFYKNNKTFGARETQSRQMRHSQPTASKNLFKSIRRRTLFNYYKFEARKRYFRG